MTLVPACLAGIPRRLPVDVIKIDQTFVRDMLDVNDLAIVEGIIALSRAFRRQVVAEGVESQAHYLRLQELGCAVGQGLHHRPADAAAQSANLAGQLAATNLEHPAGPVWRGRTEHLSPHPCMHDTEDRITELEIRLAWRDDLLDNPGTRR